MPYPSPWGRLRVPCPGLTRLRAVLSSLPSQTCVLVVGAGPTGLLLAVRWYAALVLGR
jgi:threonine dehydrogenase-like Zn-dependent dehydrogenase